MITPIEIVHSVHEFLERTPISGAEAERMTLCKQWIASMEKRLSPPAAAPTYEERTPKTL